MTTGQVRNSRGFIAISFIAVLFVLAAACGGEVSSPAAGGTAAPSAEVEHPPSSPTVLPSATDVAAPAVSISADGESWEQVGVPDSSSNADTTESDPTEPPLINTPSPVANTAPDFTLPSIQGVNYSLSQFRGERPVAVVFYRAYW